MQQSRSRNRGVASLEALFGMTVLIVLWAGVKFVGQAYVLSLQAQRDARYCAWQIAAQGCKDVPAACESQEEEGDTPGGEDLAQAGDGAAGDAEQTRDVQEQLDNEIKGVFKKRVNARGQYEMDTPFRTDGERAVYARSFGLACNTRPKPHPVEGLMEKLVNNFTKK